MPVPENIKLQVRVNGGAWQSSDDLPNGLTVVATDVVEMRVNNDAGISSYLFQIYEYPTGFTLPAGWTQDTDEREYYSTAALPPSFTVPGGTSIIGRWILRVVINEAQRLQGGEPRPAPDLIDSLGVDKVFPSGLKDTPFFEGDEFDQLRQGGNAAMKHNWRVLDDLALSGGAGQNNVGENVGDGADVYKTMNGVALQFRGVKGDGDRISTAVVGDNIVVSFDDTGLEGGGEDGDPDVITHGFIFDDPTTDGDPGTPKVRFSNASPASTEWVYIDLVDAEGRTLTGLYDSILLGNLKFVEAANVANWVEFAITGQPTTATGYRKIPVQWVAGQGDFDDDDVLRCQITRLRRVPVGGDIFDYAFQTEVGGGDPGIGGVALNAAPESATKAFVDSESLDAGDIDAFLQTCSAGTLTISKSYDPEVRHNYDITGVTDQAGYVEYEIVWRSGDGSINDGDPVRVAFTRSNVRVTPNAGLGALGRFWRTHYGNDESPPGAVEFELIFVPGRNEWIKVHVGSPTGPGFSYSAGALAVQRVMDTGESGETAAAPVDLDMYGGFNDGFTYTVTGIPAGGSYRGPLQHEVIPGETPRILVTYGRTTGNGSSTRIMRSDDGGFTWATGNFFASNELGATCLIYTGENVVAGFSSGAIEYSSDGGVAFADGDSPLSDPLYVAMSDGAGKVVLVGHGVGAISEDHGESWTELDFPAAFVVRAGVYFNQEWIIWTADQEVLKSTDGVTWEEMGSLDLNCAGWETTTMLENAGRGLVICGDYLVALFHDILANDYYKKDFFYSRDGLSWTRSWSFGEGPAVMAQFEADADGPLPWRVRVSCSSPRTPAHSPAPWHQIMLVPATGDIGQGGFADTYIGERDWGASVVVGQVTEAPAYAPSPSAVGGVASPGSGTDYALGSRHRDIGRKASSKAVATVVNLDNATGDYVHFTGSGTIEQFLLASGLRREGYADSSFTLEHSSLLVLPTGSDITTQVGDTFVLRGEGGGVVTCTSYHRKSGAALVSASGAPVYSYNGPSVPLDVSGFGSVPVPLAGKFSLTWGTAITAGGMPALVVTPVPQSGEPPGTLAMAAMNRGGIIKLYPTATPTKSIDVHVWSVRPNGWTSQAAYWLWRPLDIKSLAAAWDPSVITAEFTHTIGASLGAPVRSLHIHRATGQDALVLAGTTLFHLQLAMPWSLRSWQVVDSLSLSSYDNAPRAAVWNSDGTRIFYIGNQHNALRQLNMTSRGRNLSEAVEGGVSVGLGDGTDPQGLAISPDDKYIYVLFNSNNKIVQYAFTTWGTLTGLTGFGERDIGALTGETSPTCLAHGGDGATRHFYVLGSVTDQIHHITTTEHHISTAVLADPSPDQEPLDNAITGLAVAFDGSKLFGIGDQNDVAIEWNLIPLEVGTDCAIEFVPKPTLAVTGLSAFDAGLGTYGGAFGVFNREHFAPNAVTTVHLHYAWGTVSGEVADEAFEFDGSAFLVLAVQTNGGTITGLVQGLPSGLVAHAEVGIQPTAAIDGSGNLKAALSGNAAGVAIIAATDVIGQVSMEIKHVLNRGQLDA
jgi:hypothetical protein